jgi:hypothetical protein
MCNCEYWHLEADERVDKGERHVLGIGIWPDCGVVSMAWAVLHPRPTLLDSLCGNEEGDEDALPEREEEDSLDAEEFGYAMAKSARSERDSSDWLALTDRPEGLEILGDADPEHCEAAERFSDGTRTDGR